MSQYHKPEITPELKLWIGVIELAMRAYPTPISQKELSSHLMKVFTVSPEELKNMISYTIMLGRKKGYFKWYSPGRWGLGEEVVLQ